MTKFKLGVPLLALLFSLLLACSEEPDAAKHGGAKKQKNAADAGSLNDDRVIIAPSSNEGDAKPDGTVEITESEVALPGNVADGVDDIATGNVIGGEGGDDDIISLEGEGGKGDSDDPGEDPPLMEEPEVVVDLPEEACFYNDVDMQAFVIAKDQFGPGLPPVAVPSTIINGGIQQDGETYIGFFTLFQEHSLSPNFWTQWDGQAGRVPYDYTLVVVDSMDATCTAFLRFVKQNPRTLGGCFDINTKIRMADGKDMVVAAISEGDMVFNPVTKKAQRVSEVVRGKEAKPMWEIALKDHKILVTENHPMPVKGGLKAAKDVTTADYLYDEKGVLHRVSSVKMLPANPEQMVVNLSLEAAETATEHHMVLADGVVTGDLILQRQLEASKPKVAAK